METKNCHPLACQNFFVKNIIIKTIFLPELSQVVKNFQLCDYKQRMDKKENTKNIKKKQKANE